MQAQTVTVEQDGAVAIVRLDRAHKRNALDDSTVLALEAAFSGLPDTTRAAVLCAAGEHFCAGLDLAEITDRGLESSVQHSRMWHRAFDAIEFGRVPVVAALTGAVIGGGLELAAACHLRVADPSTFYALPEGQRGIYTGGGASVRLPRLIGLHRMRDMMLTGRSYDAASGAAAGFSEYLAEPGGALAQAQALAEKIAGNAPMTNFALIHALPRIAEADPAAGYLMEALTAAVASSAPEAQQRLEDFLSKRGSKVARPQT